MLAYAEPGLVNEQVGGHVRGEVTFQQVTWARRADRAGHGRARLRALGGDAGDALGVGLGIVTDAFAGWL